MRILINFTVKHGNSKNSNVKNQDEKIVAELIFQICHLYFLYCFKTNSMLFSVP